MNRKKQKFIKNGIIFEPNLEELDVFDGYMYEEQEANRKLYNKGRAKPKRYFGI